MIGLMLLVFIVVYLFISVWVVNATHSWANVNNKRPWLWGSIVAFLMYNLVFWDLIPTLIVHKQYCNTQAGITVYKTPEQWKRENPETQLTELSNHTYVGTDNDHTSTEAMNQRFNLVSKLNPVSSWLPIYNMETYIEDVGTKKILIQRKDYLSGYRGRNGIGQLKVWMSPESCDKGNKTLLAFGLIEEKFRNFTLMNQHLHLQ